jgi:hypothetical protein
MEVLVSTLPSVSLVEETEERLVERISLYQVLCLLIEVVRGMVHSPLCFVLAKLLDLKLSDLN